MHNFNFKSLAFYAVAIGSVLLLFKAITTYGEKHLKAPGALSDRYRLALSESLPDCPKSDALMLNIQQSGVYLNASLLPATSNSEILSTIENNPPLTGKLSNERLNLSGEVSSDVLCNNPLTTAQANPGSQKHSLNSVKINMKLAQGGTHQGEIIVNEMPHGIGFIAEAQKAPSKSENSNHP
ncbi:MAG: hypothetical protein VKL59_00375 [Nostocaceae cyanobacterium]|nr:hypothetical protein [Nostocaceae cyanobacterium]